MSIIASLILRTAILDTCYSHLLSHIKVGNIVYCLLSKLQTIFVYYIFPGIIFAKVGSIQLRCLAEED